MTSSSCLLANSLEIGLQKLILKDANVYWKLLTESAIKLVLIYHANGESLLTGPLESEPRASRNYCSFLANSHVPHTPSTGACDRRCTRPRAGLPCPAIYVRVRVI